MELLDLKDWLQTSKAAVDLLKAALSMLPKGKQKDDIEAKVREASDLLARSDAKLAKDLGYHLCLCAFPPNTMLSKGYHPVHGMELFKCDACGKQIPSEHDLRGHDLVNAHNARAERGPGFWG